MVLYFIHDTAIGFALFELKGIDETQVKIKELQQTITDFGNFSTVLKFRAFQHFNAEMALENSLQVAKGILTNDLQTFIQENIPQTKKKGKVNLAFLDNKLAKEVSEQLGYECKKNQCVDEIFRGIRMHFSKFLKSDDYKENDLERAQLGLAHSWSRNRISFDINRQDKPIIQSICVLEQLDKDLNTMAMRLKEWYSWHFPEMAKIVTDNQIYSKLVAFIGAKSSILENDQTSELEEITLDADIATQIIEAAKTSMGQEFSEVDQLCVFELAKRLDKLYEFRKSIQNYLKDRMLAVAPNLTTLIGESLGAKLIQHSGGLANLIKYPASTIQILGAEKALFRALKQRSSTPKYGLLYHSSFIGKAQGKSKGKISRYLANKCSLASRMDYFLVKPTPKFGERMKTQVDDRLNYLNNGGECDKNIDVMDTVLQELKDENLYFENDKQMEKKKKKKSKKAEKQSTEVQEEMEEEQVVKKKSKKNKAKEIEQLEEEIEEEEQIQVVKKKKKKQKQNIELE